MPLKKSSAINSVSKETCIFNWWRYIWRHHRKRTL